jgi:formylglycine-generating enzyme required for sulfatase activity
VPGEGGVATSGNHAKRRLWRLQQLGLPGGHDSPAKDPQKDLKLDLGDGVTMEFVYIKPGTFVMGGESEKDGKWECVEVPKHEVTITKGFLPGQVRGDAGAVPAHHGRESQRAAKDPNCPVDTIGEDNTCGGFLREAIREDRPAVRLPTEAEWEYACRAGSKTVWFFGDDPAQLGDYAWFKDNDGGKSHPVGQKKPNPWGLYDIYGNVCERVSDIYARDYYAKSPKEDPVGPGGRGIRA